MSTKSLPSVSVVMPILNEEDYLEAAVESILKQEYAGNWDLALVLGPSTDRTNEIAEQLKAKSPRIRLVANPAGKTTVGMNLAVSQTNADIIVRVDAHTKLPANYIRDGVAILQKHDASLLGGVMLAVGDTPIQKAIAWGYNSPIGLGGAVYHGSTEEQEAESAYLGIFVRENLVAVGGYNENIIRGEDWDLAQRIKVSGGTVWFTPKLKVKYWPRSSYQALAKQFYSTGVWRGHLTKSNVKIASLRYFVPPLAVLSIVGGALLAPFIGDRANVPLALYVFAIIVSAISATGVDSKTRMQIPLALATMHMSWGVGFIRGLFPGATSTIDKSRVTL